MTLWERLRYGWHDVKEGWRDRRHFGWWHFFKALRLIGSFVFGYRVKCFTCRLRIASWDPIVGAYCTPCFDELINTHRVKPSTPPEAA